VKVEPFLRQLLAGDLDVVAGDVEPALGELGAAVFPFLDVLFLDGAVQVAVTGEAAPGGAGLPLRARRETSARAAPRG